MCNIYSSNRLSIIKKAKLSNKLYYFIQEIIAYSIGLFLIFLLSPKYNI